MPPLAEIEKGPSLNSQQSARLLDRIGCVREDGGKPNSNVRENSGQLFQPRHAVIVRPDSLITVEDMVRTHGYPPTSMFAWRLLASNVTHSSYRSRHCQAGGDSRKEIYKSISKFPSLMNVADIRASFPCRRLVTVSLTFFMCF